MVVPAMRALVQHFTPTSGSTLHSVLTQRDSLCFGSRRIVRAKPWKLLEILEQILAKKMNENRRASKTTTSPQACKPCVRSSFQSLRLPLFFVCLFGSGTNGFGCFFVSLMFLFEMFCFPFFSSVYVFLLCVQEGLKWFEMLMIGGCTFLGDFFIHVAMRKGFSRTFLGFSSKSMVHQLWSCLELQAFSKIDRSQFWGWSSFSWKHLRHLRHPKPMKNEEQFFWLTLFFGGSMQSMISPLFHDVVDILKTNFLWDWQKQLNPYHILFGVLHTLLL